MIEKKTLIDKIGVHPRIWAAVTLAAALCCILLGTLGLLPIKTVSLTELNGQGEVFSKAEGKVVRVDDESFEKRNTFCRFFPTGVQYFYLAYTKDEQPVFVRADKEWSEGFEYASAIEVYGAVNRFSADERIYMENEYAVEAEGFVDLIYVRLNVLLIASGVLLLADTALGALMIKEKIPSQSKGYGFANILFCALPVLVAALWIHIAGYI